MTLFDKVEYHKLTGATYLLGDDMFTDKWLLEFHEALKQQPNRKEFLYLLNASNLVQSVKDFGQVSVSNILGVNQASLSTTLRMLKTHLEVIQPLLHSCSTSSHSCSTSSHKRTA